MPEYEEFQIRKLLIDTCYSSKVADQYFVDRLTDADLLALLVKIAADKEGHLGDAPMAAAHYMSQFPPEMLVPYEAALCDLFPEAFEYGYGASVALALAKTGSTRGRQLIIDTFGDGSGFDASGAEFFRKALAEYDETSD